MINSSTVVLGPTTSLLRPNRQTLSAVAGARAQERQVIRDFQLLNQSALRGETTEDRVAQALMQARPDLIRDEEVIAAAPASVHPLLRLDHRRVRQAGAGCEVEVAEVAEVEADLSIFDSPVRCSVREFDFDE